MIDEEQIRDVDARRTAAMVAGDLNTLRELIADDCRYVHSTGVSDTRDSYLAAIESGALAYTWIRTAEHIFIRAGDAMLVPHEMRAELVRAGVPEPYRSRAVAVWRTDAGDPRLVYFQATALPVDADGLSPGAGKPLAG